MGNCTSSGATKTKQNRPNQRGLDDTKHPKSENFDDDEDDEENEEANRKRGLDDTKHVKGSKANTAANSNVQPKKSLDEINQQYRESVGSAKNKTTNKI